MESIGSIRLVRRLGAGSFATVWLGHDTAFGDHPVAVKVLAENWADNEDVRNRFHAEARLMHRITDERIVRVYSIGSLPDGRPFFVMDYCDAGSLNDLRRSPGDPRETLRLCAEACRALDVLHRHHVVHRDVTPGNLLLHSNADGSLRVRLADLGVAKEMIGQQGVTMTAGTPAFMAPEQATSHPLGPRADIYAMACVTYAVLTGEPPFAVKCVQDVIGRTGDEMPPPLAARIGAPPQLDGLLQAALSLDPERRPATADIMATALDQIAQVMATVPSGLGAPPAQPWPQPAVAEPGVAETAVAGPAVAGPAGVRPVAALPDHPSVPPTGALEPTGGSPAWQFWLLIGSCGLLVFLGVMFLTLFLLP